MKRILVYSGIVIGILAVLFIVLVLGAAAIANDPAQRESYAYIVGYSFGMLIMFVAGVVLIFGMYKLTVLAFSKKEEPQEDNILDEDGPIDRYLK